MQQHYAFAPTRGDIAGALHEWHAALAAAMASVEAELFAYTVVVVMEHLGRHTTFHDVVNAFFFSEITLMRLVTDLCAEGEMRLQPRLVMGASCALRLRQLVRDASR
jgi:hypothetical protein